MVKKREKEFRKEVHQNKIYKEKWQTITKRQNHETAHHKRETKNLFTILKHY